VTGAGEGPPAIEVRGVHKRFRARRRGRALLTPWRPLPPIVAVERVDLVVRAGELVTLLGPNGAGKSTLLKMIGALITPSDGTIRVLGHDVTRAPNRAKAALGYVLADERSFYWRLSVRDNLRFFAALQDLMGAEAQARIEALASLLGLVDYLDREFADLSTGQRQRVAIARGLLADPPVLMFDEATRSLDPGRAAGLRRVIREVLVEREGKAVLFATHDLDEARALSDRTVLMRAGRVAAEGRFGEVEAEVRSAFAAEASAEAEEFRRAFPELAPEAEP
jgi:ABC-2 type transport system ATP-binding protein